MAFLQNESEIQGVKFGQNWVGLIAPFAKAGAAQTGWLLCNGAAVSRSTYSVLYGIVSTTWGSGDGNSTFNVPDMRGEFLRGWDNGRGVDSGRNMGSAQGSYAKCQYFHCWEQFLHYGGGPVSPNSWDLLQLKHPGYPDNHGGEPALTVGFNWFHSACGIGYNQGRWCVHSGGSNRGNNRSVQFMIKY